MHASSVYVIIVNWNGLEDTRECVESCVKLDYPNFRIVLVDNGSDDGSRDQVAALGDLDPRIDVIFIGENLGYAGGNNVGIAHALDRYAEYVWLLNNDTTVDTKAISALVDAAETHPNAGMIGSKIYYYDEPDVIWFAGARINPITRTAHHIGWGITDWGQYDEIVSIEYVTGCSLLARSDVIKQIGPMTEDYFLYWEEVDWCIRARNAGWDIVLQPASKVWHKVSRATSKTPQLMIRYEMRNRLMFGRRFMPAGLWRFIRVTTLDALHEYRQGDQETASSVLAGIWDFVLGRTGKIPYQSL